MKKLSEKEWSPKIIGELFIVGGSITRRSIRLISRNGKSKCKRRQNGKQ